MRSMRNIQSQPTPSAFNRGAVISNNPRRTGTGNEPQAIQNSRIRLKAPEAISMSAVAAVWAAVKQL